MDNMNMDLKVFAAKSRNRLLIIIIPILTLFVIFNIFKAQNKAIEALKSAKEDELKRNELLSKVSKSEVTLGVYKKLLRVRDASSAINTISDIARKSGAQVNSLKPETEIADKKAAYVKYPFSLTLSADSYHAVGKFISGLESYPDIYFIERMSIRKKGAESNLLDVSLTVSTIAFKDR